MADPVDPNALPPLPAAPAAATPAASSSPKSINLGGNGKYLLVVLVGAFGFLTYSAIGGTMPAWAMNLVGGFYEWLGVAFLTPAMEPDGSILALKVGGLLFALIALNTALAVIVGTRLKK